MPEKNVVLKLKDNLALFIAIIAVLGFLSQAIGFPARVLNLENKVDNYEMEIAELKKEINVLQNSIADIHARTKTIETTTNQISGFLLKKGLEK